MQAPDIDPYQNFVCAILKKAMDDAVDGKNQRDRAWLNFEDCAELCEMAGIDCSSFRAEVRNRINEHDRDMIVNRNTL